MVKGNISTLDVAVFKHRYFKTLIFQVYFSHNNLFSQFHLFCNLLHKKASPVFGGYSLLFHVIFLSYGEIFSFIKKCPLF